MVGDAQSLQTFLEFLCSEESPPRDLPCVLYYTEGRFLNQPVLLYNCEQLSRQFHIELFLKLASNPHVKEVWDYSVAHCAILKSHGITARHVPLISPKAYIDQVVALRVPPDVDVGFCGCLSERRLAILNGLLKAGLTVHCVTQFGLERDKRLARCRVLLNVHFSDDYTIFEQARCDVWLRAGVPVISETSVDDDTRCINVPYALLVEKVRAVVEGLKSQNLE